MKSKKIVCVVLTALISVGLVSNTYAQEPNTIISNAASANMAAGSAATENNSKISKDAAKDIAKTILKDYFDTNIDETLYQTNINFRPDFEVGPINKNYLWQINWNYHDEQKDTNINITVDASTGKVVNVNNMTFLHKQTSQIAAISEDEAKVIGENFLKKINPQEFSQCKLINNDDINNGLKGDPTVYNFIYSRTLNGIPFLGNYLSIGVDSVTGKVRSYGFRWSGNQVPSKNGIIQKDKALQAFKDNLKFDLKYIPCRDEYGYNNEAQTVKLVYMPDTSSGINLDAKEGKMLDYNNINSSDKKVKDLDENQKKSFIAGFKPLQQLDKELDSSSAEAIMKGMVKDIYGDGYDIESINYQDSNKAYGLKVSCWSAQFIKKNSNSGLDQGQITVDSSTGQLISIDKFNAMNRFAADDNFQSKLTWEQAYEKAINLVEKYFPDKVKDINTQQTYIQNTVYFNNVAQIDRFYGFNFNRLINGISYQDDSINVNFDTKTGEINNVYSRWTRDLKVPSADGIINKDDARDIFFKKYNPELAYTLINTSKDPKNPAMEVKLVYSILNGLQYSPLNNIDGFTGKFVDFNGQEIDNNASAFKSKIKGNPAEKELSILAVQGIIDTKSFDLNKKTTRADLIKMLVNAKGYRPYMLNSAQALRINYSGAKGDEIYKYLQAAVSYGILDNSGDFKGDEAITREEMIKDIVKLLGYDDIAKAKGIFTLSYSDAADITPDNIGYVAISKGLGLINDTDNKFMPKEQVTITDAALAIYKALGRIRNN